MNAKETSDILNGLSPMDLIRLRDRCEMVLAQRKNAINGMLSTHFHALDPAFIRVAVDNHDGRPDRTPFRYHIRHPRQEEDPVVYRVMTVTSQRIGDRWPCEFWLSPDTTEQPTQEQLDKIKAIDPALRSLYNRLMNNPTEVCSMYDTLIHDKAGKQIK
jgi:hypothetical protein